MLATQNLGGITGRGTSDLGVRVTLLILLTGLAVAVLVFLISGGHVVFLPLILLLPFGFFLGRRRG